MLIQYYEKNVYGNICRYITEGKTAQAVYMLTGRKTLSETDMQALELLGYTFEKVIDTSYVKIN